MVTKYFGGLWRHQDFRNLWAGQTTSMLASSITAVAIPIIASISLSASVVEMGFLSATAYLPYLLASLFIGVWLDRSQKRPIIIGADLFRAAALLVIPIAWWQGFISIPLLIVVNLLVGLCSVVADNGNDSILPVVLDRSDLVEGNSKLEVSRSASTIAGKALGGAVVQAFSVPIAVLFNSVFFALSTFFTFRIRTREAKPERTEEQRVWSDIAEGGRFVLGNRTIRVLVLATMIANFFALGREPIYLIFVTRTLELSPIWIGLIFAADGVGALIGALVSKSISRALPLGRLLVLTSALVGVVSLLVPLASVLPVPLAVAVLIIAGMLDSALIIVCNVNLRSYRSSITPDSMQGRMAASIRMAVIGVGPIGALAGGYLGAWLGTTPALVIISLGIISAAAPIAFSHIRHVQAIPAEAPPEVEIVDDQNAPGGVMKQ